MSDSRRKFLQKLSVIPALPLLNGDAFLESPKKLPTFPILANEYNWTTFYKREGKTGLKAFEPSFNSSYSGFEDGERGIWEVGVFVVQDLRP
jgi:hypothetical protein